MDRAVAGNLTGRRGAQSEEKNCAAAREEAVQRGEVPLLDEFDATAWQVKIGRQFTCTRGDST